MYASAATGRGMRGCGMYVLSKMLYRMMQQYLCFFVSVLFLVSFEFVNSIDVQYTINVYNRGNGSCHRIEAANSSTCSSLESALATAHLHSNLAIYLLDSEYTLTADESVTSFDGIQQFELVGMLSSAVVIRCDEMSGFSFYNSTNISFKNVTLLGCGAPHNSSSIDFSQSEYTMTYLQILAGVYFLLCENITFSFASVSDSPGIGVVFYSTSGVNLITHSDFTNNVAFNRSIMYQAGGGGIAIEFLYCLPGDVYCSRDNSSIIPTDRQTQSSYTISNCLFENNNGSTGNYTEDSFVVPHWNYNVALGRGGGLLVLFKGSASRNRITIDSCVFQNNAAVWGGGTVIEFQDSSQSNEVFVQNSTFVDNNCFYDSCSYHGTGGGGARVQMAGVDKQIKDNSVVFSDTKFHNNNAYFGGGISFITFPEDVITNSIVFKNVEWKGNIARLGSAVDLSIWHLTTGLLLQPVFINCTFVQNTIEYTDKTGTAHGAGTLYVDSLSVTFKQEVSFSDNVGSAITSTDGAIFFDDSITAIFENNLADFGGAIALYNKAHLLLMDHARLYFNSNVASLHGGAIYWEGIGNHELVSSRNCFIRYHNSFVYPSDWQVSLEFLNNTARLTGNAIYGTTLLGCLWGGRPYGQLLNPQEEYDNVFCWEPSSPNRSNVWNYIDSHCNDSIATSPGYFAFENGTINCGAPYIANTIPGTVSSFPIELLDDRLSVIPERSVIFTSYNNNSNSNVQYTAFEDIPLYGIPGDTVQYTLSSIRPRVVSTQISLTFDQCPPGFLLEPEKMECIGARYPFVLTRANLTSSIQRGYWIGQIDGETVVAQCSYCPFNPELSYDNYIDLPRNHSQLEQYFCEDLNREGPLCRSCKEGYAPAVNSEEYKCIECSNKNAKYSWFLYLLTEYVPITIILAIVIIFNISVTSGPLNSFVFFAQVISTTFGVDADGLIPYPSISPAASTLRQTYISIYGVWNLNFYLSYDWALFCLAPNVTTLHLLALNYITAVYPLVVLLLIWTVVTLYYSNYRVIVCLVRPLHRLFARGFSALKLQRSIMDAFATFIVLSYAKFAATSAVLLYPNGLYNSEGKIINFVSKYDGDYQFTSARYAPFLISSIGVSLLVCVSMPTLLFLYSIKPFYRFLEKIRFTFLLPGEKSLHFLNSFYHCYKDGTTGGYDQRYFASLLFFIKLVIIFSYSYALNWAQQYIIQQVLCTIAILMISVFQPYKKMLYNIVDACIFSILAVINVLTLYNRYLDIADLGLSMLSYYVQIVLIFAPLVYIVSYIIYIVYQIKSVKTKVVKTRRRLTTRLGLRNSNIQSTNTDFDFGEFIDDVTTEGRFYSQNYHGPLKPDELNRDVGDDYEAAVFLVEQTRSNTSSIEIIELPQGEH